MAKRKKIYHSGTFWTIVISSIIAILIGVPTVIYARGAYIEAKRGADIQRDQNKIIIQADIQHNAQQKVLVNDGGTLLISLSVNNVGTVPILSDEGKMQGYDAYSQLKFSYKDSEGKEVGNFMYSFLDKIEPGVNKNIDVSLEAPMNTEKIQVFLVCNSSNDSVKPCLSRGNILDITILKGFHILGVDATRKNDLINLGVFREEIRNIFGISETDKFYKTVPAGIEFPLIHKDLRESWGGIILLYNPLKHSADSPTTKNIIASLGVKYNYASVIVKEYNQENFNFYTQRFFECKPEGGKNICVSKTMKFKDMNSGADPKGNLFSKTIFTENPDLDFMFILPYNNKK